MTHPKSRLDKNVYTNALKKKERNTAWDKSFIISTKKDFSYLLKQCLIHSQVRDASAHEGEMKTPRAPSASQRVCFPAAHTETTSRCLASRSKGLEETPYMCGKMPTDTLLQCTHNQIFAHTHRLPKAHTDKQMINNRANSDDLTVTSLV